MAAREKKTKNLSNSNASRESPTTSKQTSLLSYITSTPSGKAEGAEGMNSAGGEASAGGRRGPPKGKGGRPLKKLSPTTKINTLRGKKKTKANFKLNIITAKAVAVNRRGRPPLKKETAEKGAEEEPRGSEDPGAKTRGRKRGTTGDGAEDKLNESSETNKTSPAKESDNKKTVIKTLPKKVVKKKQLIVAQKGITKKKVLLVKQIIKTDAKQVDPKVLKKNLTAKLKSVSEKLEAKKDTAEDNKKEVSGSPAPEVAEPAAPVANIKRESDLLDVPSSVPNSRSSSPRSGSARKRNSADVSISKNVPTEMSAIPSSIKSPYSTRSERSKSPFPTVGENPQKLLRNGKQRKFKIGLKKGILSENIGLEFGKRRRLLSEQLDEFTKVKRLRSSSRDGSEISKCSDITESDLSFCDTQSIHESNKTLENKDNSTLQGISLEDIKSELSSPESSPVTTKSLLDSSPAAKLLQSKVAVLENAQGKGDCMDNENNNTDEKIKTDALFVSEKLNKGDAIDTAEETLKLSQNEKIAEKSFILDNMSKTFNDITILSKTKTTRRSARQRKSTVKAKEQEETVLSEKDGLELEVAECKLLNTSTNNCTVNSSSNESVLDETKEDKREESLFKPINSDPNPTKITTKKFYGEAPTEDKKATTLCDTPEELVDSSLAQTNTSLPSVHTQDGDDSIKLHFDEDDEHDDCPIDDSAKENIQAGYTNKAYSNQDIDKLIDKLRNFEELDKKRQEEKMCTVDKMSVMVTNDVVLIPKSNIEIKSIKDLPHSIIVEKSEKPKENVLSCFENNSAISIVKKDQVRKSFEIELPSSVTLIKRPGTSSRKHSTGSINSKEDSVSVIDKTLCKDVTLELRKSIDKGILSLESTAGTTKSSTISTGNGQSISISLKPQPATTVIKDCITVTPTQPLNALPPANPVTALISLPAANHLMITPVPLASSITPVAPITAGARNSIDAIAPTSTTPVIPATPATHPSPSSTTPDIPKAQDALKLLNTQLIPEPSITLTNTLTCNVPAITIVPSVSLHPSAPVLPSNTTICLTNSIPSTLIRPPSELTITPETLTPTVAINELTPKLTIETADSSNRDAPTKLPDAEKCVKKGMEPVASLASMALPLVTPQVTESKSAVSPPPPVILPIVESPEKQKQKEKILRILGLLTLKEADEAKLEKIKLKELLTKSNKSAVPKASNSDGYTGTLKTVIKINRTSPDKKKSRSPLKMTFQKSKSRGNKLVSDGASGDSESDDSPHYTIHKEFGGSSACSTGGIENHITSGGHRKTHYSNRFNNHESAAVDPLADVPAEATVGKEVTPNLVIPEKASSFAIHPGRLCQDQCFYCGGKFGLFDTPCHVAQIKSLDRQNKILANEEKLTVDSCLCDACYRHVDRRANCPGYRRRALGSGGPLAVSATPGAGALCHVRACRSPAPHSLRRKWLVKMKASVAKVVQLDLDYPGLHTIPLCDSHYQAISPLMVCGLCKRSLSRNHIHYINQEYQKLNPIVAGIGLPVIFRERPVVCKLCRYFCTLLLRPPAAHQLNKKSFLVTYRRRLLQAHNLEIPEELGKDSSEHVAISDGCRDQSDSNKERKKGKNGKNKTKKSSEIRKSTEMNSSKNSCNSENTPDVDHNKKDSAWKDRNSSEKSHGGIEEDIESLISTNTIPIPHSNSKPGSHTEAGARTVSEISDNSDLDTIDYDNPLITAMDKQSELQYLLQRCNVPSSTILQRGPISNLTQKSRNILKVHNASTISKNQKIQDKNARRIQKLGQIITKNSDIEKALCSKLPNREEFTIETTNNPVTDPTGLSVLRNIALNDECTIETIPPKTSSKGVDFHSLKSKLHMSNSFTQIKKNLNALSRRPQDDSHKKKSSQRDNFSNPVRRLETNPSISVRELFPGEEEMNLQCSIEFGNLKGITPEGWEKSISTIQYDSDTKKLWHELQKPYGNQSSFLRHLILLEKYFRNGDLVLAQNANCNAVTYSESVQNRLRSYDNIPSNGESAHLPYYGNLLPKNSSLTVLQQPSPPPFLPPDTIPESGKKSESSSLIDFRRQKSGAVSGKSLLKTNQSPTDHPKTLTHKSSASLARPLDSFLPPSVNHAKIPKNVPISMAQINQSVDQSYNVSKLPKNVPISLSQLEKLSNQVPLIHLPSVPRPPTPRPDISIPDPKTTAPKTDTHPKLRTASLPPELIAINSQHSTQRKSIENVLKNIQQLAKGSSTPVSQSIPPPSLQTPGVSPIATGASKLEDLPPPPAKKTKGPSKQWRPTLIPITDDSKLRSTSDVLYQTADGRRLPSLVQVMSGGKPYHITIQDYNKMCVMRREKLKQQQKAQEHPKKPSSTGSLPPPPSTEISCDTPPTATVTSDTKAPSPVSATPEVIEVPPEDKSAEWVTAEPSSGKELVPMVEKVAALSILEPSAVSLLKNVGLKNITIGPVSTLAESKSSLLLPGVTVLSQVPGDSGQAVLLPKLPRSLTVIPQVTPFPPTEP